MCVKKLTAQEGIRGSKSMMLTFATASTTDRRVELDNNMSNKVLDHLNVILTEVVIITRTTFS